jgi:hypothetical protein
VARPLRLTRIRVSLVAICGRGPIHLDRRRSQPGRVNKGGFPSRLRDVVMDLAGSGLDIDETFPSGHVQQIAQIVASGTCTVVLSHQAIRNGALVVGRQPYHGVKPVAWVEAPLLSMSEPAIRTSPLVIDEAIRVRPRARSMRICGDRH